MTYPTHPLFTEIDIEEQTRLNDVYSQSTSYTPPSYKPTAVLMGHTPILKGYPHASVYAALHQELRRQEQPHASVYAALQQELHRLNGYLRVSPLMYEEEGVAVYNPNECVNRAWVSCVEMEGRRYLRMHADGVAVWYYAEQVRELAVSLASNRHPVERTAIFGVRALTTAWERYVDGELNAASREENEARREIAKSLPLTKGVVPSDDVVDITNRFIEAYKLKQQYADNPLYACIIRIGPDYCTGYTLLPYTRGMVVRISSHDEGTLLVGGKECFAPSDLPMEAQEKIALLSMTQQNEYLTDVGMRVFDNTFILSHG